MIEDTSFAGIGSDEDKVARAAAAKIDFKWSDDVGTEPGLKIWRVENRRTENDNPDFGIFPWPESKYGSFHRGDSYIILQTILDPHGGDKLLHDIYFWIGSESTADEYGVAAYKTVELDGLLGGEPMQHREVEGMESKEFVKCFPKGISYLEGGVPSGFRKVEKNSEIAHIRRLYRVYKKNGEKTVRCFEVPSIYTVSPFERNMCVTVAHNIKENRLGKCQVFSNIGNDGGEFWELLGGMGEIKPAEEMPAEVQEMTAKKMYVISDSSGMITMKEVPPSKSSLVSDDVCIVDAGSDAYVWIGKGATTAEKQQAMLLSSRYLKEIGRYESTRVTRVLEGQEGRCKPFLEVFAE
ncbi:hypothetical protein ACHAW5_004656 [Stephanodiscus triporus]|uniref:Gelsolin-like domain-containing protein n=1 Tax=Stephanodiscus triporus TaxID=2934178 RepID=A0ABD3MHC1_9STRA